MPVVPEHGEEGEEGRVLVASFPGLPRFLFFGLRSVIFLRSSAYVYYTERNPKNEKRRRPGNEASCHVHVLLTRASRFRRCAQFFPSLLTHIGY